MNLNLTIDFDRLRDLVFRTFQNPTADLVSSAFVLSAILVVLLMLVLVFSLLLTPKRRKVVKIRRYRRVVQEGAGEQGGEVGAADPVEPVDADTTPEATTNSAVDVPPTGDSSRTAKNPSSARAIVGGIVSFVFSVPVLIALALVGGYWVSGTNDFCARTCHAGVEQVHSASKIDHASCADCHEQPGVAGIPANVYTRASMGVAQVLGRELDGRVVIDSSACLRCHQTTITQTVETARGIRISHKELNQAGQTCVSCHPQTGHDTRRDYTMSACLPCHDGKKATNDCAVCHTSDPYDGRPRAGSGESTSTIGSGKISYPVVRVANRNCGGCHNQERECDTCHGLRMPHDQQFLNGGHARLAAWEKKQMCYKCHEPNSCTTGCHIGPFPGHYDGFKEDHKKARKTDGCACHAQKWGRTKPMCVLCHDF